MRKRMVWTPYSMGTGSLSACVEVFALDSCSSPKLTITTVVNSDRTKKNSSVKSTIEKPILVLTFTLALCAVSAFVSQTSG
jgi:hypothetical protein